MQRTHGSGIIGTTSTEVGTLENALFQVNTAVAFPCAGMVGTNVDEAAMTSPRSLRTRTIAFTFVSVVMLRV